tara:strand:+ start:90 stop:380 length:291 start_codon:yes stop_codon:yes gene_type:complete
MQKIYKKLTKDQLERKVIFSSCLSLSRTEEKDDNIHEVFQKEKDHTDPCNNHCGCSGWKNENEYGNQNSDANIKIKRLLDDSFFNDSPYKYNIVRR